MGGWGWDDEPATARTAELFKWIHPFGDGNGNASRAVMYAIICVGYAQMLPGTTALPELIARNPYPYYDALDSADDAWARGTIDVSEMEALLGTLIEQQLRPSA